MSLAATSWAWRTAEAHHGARLVLLALADCHNDRTGLCCPSVVRISEMTRLERKAVLRGIAELEAANLIATERRNGCGSRYLLQIQPSETGSETGPVPKWDQSQNGTGDKTGPVPFRDETSPKMGPDQSQNGTRNRKGTGKESEPPTPGDLLKLEPDGAGDGIGFDEFWGAYPKKAGKKDAARAWQRLKPSKELAAQIVADVKRRALSRDWAKDGGQFILNPATFLNGRRWEDEAPGAVETIETILASHPGNPEWPGYLSETVTPEQRREFAQLRAQLKHPTR